MEDQICRAAQQTIADELNISRRTVVRALDLLVTNGFLEEVHTQTVNHYRDTGKANIGIKIEATVTESHSAERQKVTVKNPTVTESHSGSDTESQCTVPESHTKIVLKKEFKRLEYEDSDPDEIFSGMQRMCETLIGRLMTPADIPTIETFVREGVIEDDIKSALAWRKKEGLRPVSLLRQLEAGVLRNKAARVQDAAAETAPIPPRAIRPQAMTTLEKSLAAGRRAMQKALAEEEAQIGNPK